MPVPPTEAQREELEQRARELDADPERAIPWEEARERLRTRRGRVSARLALSPQALEDLREAADWYDGQSPGLGDAFRGSVDACLSRIQLLPRAFPESEPGTHSALLRRFPYAVLFRIERERVEVLAPWHGHRAD